MATILAAALLGTTAPALAQDALPSAPARSRDLSTDRPDKTESPYTVDAGRFQIELDFATWTIDRDSSDGGNVRTKSFAILPFNLKLGLARNTDLQIVFDSYNRQTIADRTARTRRTIDGLGDTSIRLKQNIWGNDGGRTALAIMPFVKLPTAGNGLGNDHVEGGIIVPLAISLGEGIGLGLMTEVDILRKDDGSGYAPSFVNSITAGFDLTQRLGLYTELFAEQGSADGARFVATADAGLTYAIGENTQLDAGLNVGLTDAADDLNLFIGLSRRF